MKTAIVYVFPNLQRTHYEGLARKFINSYLENPPGETPHDLYVCVNGPPLRKSQEEIFDALPITFLQHNNAGKDIGSFMKAAQTIPCDLLVCLGSHVYFHKPFWLDRLVDAYLEGGPGLYGAWGVSQPAPHIRTTAFWLPPVLLQSYPWPIGNEYRYEFEHGRQHSILRWVISCGYHVTMVGWNHALQYPNFAVLPVEENLLTDKYQSNYQAA